MPRKSLEELDAKPTAKPDAEVVVPASSAGATKKVKLDLEVDTSKDPNQSHARIIHMAALMHGEYSYIFNCLYYTLTNVILYMNQQIP